MRSLLDGVTFNQAPEPKRGPGAAEIYGRPEQGGRCRRAASIAITPGVGGARFMQRACGPAERRLRVGGGGG